MPTITYQHQKTGATTISFPRTPRKECWVGTLSITFPPKFTWNTVFIRVTGTTVSKQNLLTSKATPPTPIPFASVPITVRGGSQLTVTNNGYTDISASTFVVTVTFSYTRYRGTSPPSISNQTIGSVYTR